MAILEQFVGSILTLTQSVSSNATGHYPENRLALTQQVSINLASRTVENRLWFAHTARVIKTVGVSAENTLAFTQSSNPRTIYVEAYNGFIFWHNLIQPKHELITQPLVLIQSVTGHAAKAAKNILTLTHSVNLQVIKTNPVTNTLVMLSSATAWKEDKYWIAVPSFMYSAGPLVAFRYKGVEFEFQAPELGNKESNEYLRISRNSLGGDHQVFRDVNWPETKLLSINFDVCQEHEIAKIRELIKNSLGDFIEYRDHNGSWFDAFITNPNTAIRQTGRFAYTVSLELEAIDQ